ncbi:MAG: ABC transporter ATP-binding protein, partial [Piscinibacter sp.]|nr:ABC transporter ATP-binding protein [Piscinibacter sp.]
PPPAPAAAPARPRKLSYKEQRELDELPGRIEALEAEQKSLLDLLADPQAYTRDPKAAIAAQQRHAQIDDELMTALERWEALGSR